MMIAADRETLLSGLNRLLDGGEPLLTKFPAKWSGSWLLQLPDNISDAMAWYANEVALRAWDRETYQVYYQQDTTHYLADWVTELEVGLLGWHAIGVLP